METTLGGCRSGVGAASSTGGRGVGNKGSLERVALGASTQNRGLDPALGLRSDRRKVADGGQQVPQGRPERSRPGAAERERLRTANREEGTSPWGFRSVKRGGDRRGGVLREDSGVAGLRAGGDRNGVVEGRTSPWWWRSGRSEEGWSSALSWWPGRVPGEKRPSRKARQWSATSGGGEVVVTSGVRRELGREGDGQRGFVNSATGKKVGHGLWGFGRERGFKYI